MKKSLLVIAIVICLLSSSLMLFACDSKGTIDTSTVVDIEVYEFYGFEVKPTSTTTAILTNYTGKLTEFSFPEKVVMNSKEYTITELDANLFKEDKRITKVVLPSTLIKIGDYTFTGCTNLKDLIIPDGVTEIGSYAFSGCQSFKNITIPESVKTLGVAVFSSCSNLETINIPDAITSIGQSMFSGCIKLEQIDIPENVKTIEYSAFQNCSTLNTIRIPEGVTTISDSLFAGCTSLTTISLPSTITSFGMYSFSNCTQLTIVNFENTKLKYAGINKYSNYYKQGVPSNCIVRCTDGDTTF